MGEPRSADLSAFTLAALVLFAAGLAAPACSNKPDVERCTDAILKKACENSQSQADREDVPACMRSAAVICGVNGTLPPQR